MFSGWDLEFYRTVFTNYWWYGLFFVIYLGGLVYLAGGKSAELKQVFVWPFLIMLVSVFNPFLMEPILQRTGWQNRYSRFFWMLPAELLCAYILAVLIGRQKRAEWRAGITAMTVCLVFLCGGSATEFALDDNIYKIDDSVIEVAEMIGAASEKERPIVLYDEEMYYWIRQYDASFTTGAKKSEMETYRWMVADEIDAAEQYDSEKKAVAMFVRGIEVEPALINKVFESREIDFFVRNMNFYSEEYLKQLDLVYVDAVEGYELYRCVQTREE